jgi:hypothetical protein
MLPVSTTAKRYVMTTKKQHKTTFGLNQKVYFKENGDFIAATITHIDDRVSQANGEQVYELKTECHGDFHVEKKESLLMTQDEAWQQMKAQLPRFHLGAIVFSMVKNRIERGIVIEIQWKIVDSNSGEFDVENITSRKIYRLLFPNLTKRGNNGTKEYFFDQKWETEIFATAEELIKWLTENITENQQQELVNSNLTGKYYPLDDEDDEDIPW